MKKSTKKLVSVLLASAMAAGMLAGCGSGNGKGSTGDSKSSSAASGTSGDNLSADTSEHVDLTMYLIGDRTPDFDEVYAKINEILEEKLNCSLNVEFLSWGEHDTKYSLLFSSQEDFDLIFTASSWCHYEQTVSLGGFAPLSEDFIKTYAPDIWEVVPEMAWEQAKIDGQIYMVPSYANEFGQEVLAVRGDLMEKYGMDDITSWDDLMKFYKACAADGIYASQGGPWYPFFQSQGYSTTGGAPKGEGLDIHARLGHEIATPIPSLFTFNIADRDFLALMGTVVEDTIASLPGTKLRAEGPLLVTHWGMSGPAALKLSAHAARYLQERNYQADVAINWTGESRRSLTEEEITAIATRNPQKQLATIRPFDLPSRLWLYLLQKTQNEPTRKWGELGKKNLNRIVETLTNDIYRITGKGRFRDEFVTCGGVSLSSLDMHTLQSKHCPGLYFAGEVTDVDAITGGFNLQAAWTMGYVVGQHFGEERKMQSKIFVVTT